MKKKANLSFQVISSLLLIFIILYLLFSVFIFIKAYTAAYSIRDLQNSHEIMRVKIYGSSYSSEGDTVSASISIIDSNGNEISTVERSWSGSYLGLVFAKISLYDKSFVFPMTVFGKSRIYQEAPSRFKGTHLEKYYNDFRQCMLLGHGSSNEERCKLYWLSAFATNKYLIPQFGLVNYISLDLSGCKSEVYYSVIFEANGNISLVEI